MEGVDTGTIGEDSRTGLPGITEISGKEGGCMGTLSNWTAKIRKNQN